MNSFFLAVTLGLVSFLPALDGSRSGGCPECECCGCCSTGICQCAQCSCECCVDECPAAGATAERHACSGSGCCRG